MASKTVKKETIEQEIKEAEELIVLLYKYKTDTMPKEFLEELNDGINFWECELKILKNKLLTKK